MTRVLKFVLPAAALVAGCSAGKIPVEVVADAPAETVAEGTASLSQRLKITPAGGAGASPVVLTAKGSIDFARGRGTIVTDFGEEAVEAVFAGGTTYGRLPALAGEGGGRGWFRIGADSLGQAVGVEGLGNLVQSQSSDPSAALQYLRGVTGAVQKVGRERIRGVDTTWYETTVDLARAADRAPKEAGRAIRQISETFAVDRVPVEVWIDSRGRARRLLQRVDFAEAAATGRFPPGSLPALVEVTIEFYDFGAPVSVTIPAAADVTDLSTALDRRGSGAGSGTASPATDALEARLLGDVPPGYEQQPDRVGDTGPSDLEKAIRDDTRPDAREVLTADRFVAGYQRLWVKQGSSNIVDFVYEFEAPEGAAHYMERMLEGLTADEDDVTAFDVAAVPGARGLRTVDPEDPAAVIVLTRGRFLAQVVVSGPDAGTNLAVELARQQYDRLG